jgi:hypothetical protein
LAARGVRLVPPVKSGTLPDNRLFRLLAACDRNLVTVTNHSSSTNSFVVPTDAPFAGVNVPFAVSLRVSS